MSCRTISPQSVSHPPRCFPLCYRGFRQATRGADTGAFHHPLFRRDKPELCLDMVCQRFGDRASSNKTLKALECSQTIKNSNKRATPPATSPKSLLLQNKLVTLTKESLEQFSTPMSLATLPPASQGPVAVSDDSHSTSSNSSTNPVVVSVATGSSASVAAKSSILGTFPSLATITNDVELTRAALLKRNETERLLTAKAMLYESYCKAIRGE